MEKISNSNFLKIKKLDEKCTQISKILDSKLENIETSCKDTKDWLDHFIRWEISPIHTEISWVLSKYEFLNIQITDNQVDELSIKIKEQINFLFYANKIKNNTIFLNLIKDNYNKDPSNINWIFKDAINNTQYLLEDKKLSQKDEKLDWTNN